MTEKIKSFFTFFLVKVLPVIIFILLSFGLFFFITKEGQRTTEIFVKIHIAGAVVSPGQYELKNGSIVDDAIQKAGGFASNYDAVYVEEKINLAKKLKDEDKIFIPFKQEDTSAAEGVSITGKISINKADAKQLDLLPGIGEVTAKKIISGRPYAKVTDLVDKKIISQSVYDKIKSQIDL
ncbi:MAG: ComEA family DNA-binding protein [bacterium]